MGEFRFKRFSVKNESSAMKVGTDGVLLGAGMTILPGDKNLLDIGTGTGVIALMAAQRLSAYGDFKITAIDMDHPSVEEAAVNFAASPWSLGLSAICTPLAGFEPTGRYELIFSNPPYYDDSLENQDQRQARARHTGSLSYRELCAFAADKLAFNGRLSMILPADCEKMLLRTAASYGLRPFRFLRIRTTPQKQISRILAEFAPCTAPFRGPEPAVGTIGVSRDACMEGRTSVSVPFMEQELSLLTPDGARSPEYRALTADFYL